MSDTITFREKMSQYDRDSLKNFAYDLNLKGVSKLKKNDLIEKIAECALDPKALFYRLSLLDDGQMKLFEKGAGKAFEIQDSCYDDMKYALKLDRLELAVFSLPSHLFSSLSDVYDIYKKNIAGAEFEAYRKKVCWVLECLHWARNMYATAPMHIVLKLINTKKDLHMSEEELREIYGLIPAEAKGMTLTDDGMFVAIDYLHDMDELAYISENQADKPFYIPTVAELDEYYAYDAIISKKTYQDMQKFLEKEMNMDKVEVKFLLLDAWDVIGDYEDFQDVIMWFMKQFMLKSKKAVRRMIDLFMPLYNDTNMLCNRGFSPSNMLLPVFKHGQMPTLVPGSSQAANVMADAVPQLREMGFDLDLDGNAKEVPVYAKSADNNGTLVRTSRKVYPNDPCPCGSGKKFKKCCGR